jgi:hypothetical protein
MNVVLRVLQFLFGLHTAIGAVWKVSNAESRVPSLAALPHGVWLGLGVVEAACAAVLLLAGAVGPLDRVVPFAAGFVVAEMLLFTGLHAASGATGHQEVVYWLVVAALGAFLAVGRARRTPAPASRESP